MKKTILTHLSTCWKVIRQNAGAIVPQDRATSVVFGMPHEAIKRGATDKVLPLNKIAMEVIKRANSF